MQFDAHAVEDLRRCPRCGVAFSGQDPQRNVYDPGLAVPVLLDGQVFLMHASCAVMVDRS